MSNWVAPLVRKGRNAFRALAIRVLVALADANGETVYVQSLGEDNLPDAELDQMIQQPGIRHVPVPGMEGLAIYVNGPEDRVVIGGEYPAVDLSLVPPGGIYVFGIPSGLGLLINADGGFMFTGPYGFLGNTASAPIARMGDAVTVTIPAGAITIAGASNQSPVIVTGTITSGSNSVFA